MSAARFAISLLFVLATVSTRAHAQDAAALLEQGLALRREGRDAEAAERFRAAHAIDGSARTLAQLALAEQGAGDWVSAERNLVRAMESHDDPWIAEHRAILVAALETIRAHVGRLEVRAEVDGAELWIDGRRVGVLPLPEPIPAVAGTVVVEVRAAGYVTAQRTASVRPGELARVIVRLVALASAEPPPDDPPIANVTVAPRPPLMPAVSRGRGPSALFVMGLAGSGVVALGLVATAIAIGVRETNVAHWNDDSRCPPTLAGGRLQTCASVYATFRTAEDWAIGIGVATAAFAAACAVLVVLGASEEAGGERVEIAVSLAGGSARLRFE